MEAGGLRVGPESAGAVPGPACYGHGAVSAAITDANALLGRIPKRARFAGALELDIEAAEAALEKVGADLGLDAYTLADGAVDVVNAMMADGIREITVGRGIDPPGLRSAGLRRGRPASRRRPGRGDRHVPGDRSPFPRGALGVGDAPGRRAPRPGAIRVRGASTAWTASRWGAAFDDLRAEGRRLLSDDGVAAADMEFRPYLDLRYFGQEYTLTLPIDGFLAAGEEDRAAEAFHAAYRTRYGHSNPGEVVELVSVRIAAVGLRRPAELPVVEEAPAPAPVETAPARFGNRPVPTGVYERGGVGPGGGAGRPGRGAGGELHHPDPSRLARRGVGPRPPDDGAHRMTDLLGGPPPRSGRRNAGQVDPVTVEVIRNAFLSIARQMNKNLFRSAYTPIIYEMKDCSVGIFDREGRLLGQSPGLPMFLGNLELGIAVTTEAIGGPEAYRPGDVYMVNDPYLVGSHTYDVNVFSPIFLDGRLIGFGATKAHWLDIGAKEAGRPVDTTEIYQEGYRFGPTAVYRAGEPVREVIDYITRNSRLPRSVWGDLHAQIAACRTGEHQLAALHERFGADAVERAAEQIFAQCEHLDREAVRAVPDGVYRAAAHMDSGGPGLPPVEVCTAVSIEGDRMTIDLTGSSGPTRGPVNSPMPGTLAGARLAFKCLINPNVPVTGGTFRNLEVTAPENTVFNVSEPHGTIYYYPPLGLMIDLVIRALADVLPDEVVAGQTADPMNVTFVGRREDGSQFVTADATAVGWGASSRADGANGMINYGAGDLKNIPVEVVETKYPPDGEALRPPGGLGGHGEAPGRAGDRPGVRDAGRRHGPDPVAGAVPGAGLGAPRRPARRTHLRRPHRRRGDRGRPQDPASAAARPQRAGGGDRRGRRIRGPAGTGSRGGGGRPGRRLLHRLAGCGTITARKGAADRRRLRPGTGQPPRRGAELMTIAVDRPLPTRYFSHRPTGRGSIDQHL